MSKLRKYFRYHMNFLALNYKLGFIAICMSYGTFRRYAGTTVG